MDKPPYLTDNGFDLLNQLLTYDPSKVCVVVTIVVPRRDLLFLCVGWILMM